LENQYDEEASFAADSNNRRRERARTFVSSSSDAKTYELAASW
jgi:hypothetical protein